MISSSSGRVPAHPSDTVTERIRRQTEESVRETLAAGPERISERLRELDREWDIERAIETDAALAVVTGLALGLTVHRRFLLLSAVGAGGLVLHATSGWYPLITLFRSLGFRTADEIHAERFALKAGRGDFERLEIPLDPAAPRPDPMLVLEAVRRT